MDPLQVIDLLKARLVQMKAKMKEDHEREINMLKEKNEELKRVREERHKSKCKEYEDALIKKGNDIKDLGIIIQEKDQDIQNKEQSLDDKNNENGSLRFNLEKKSRELGRLQARRNETISSENQQLAYNIESKLRSIEKLTSSLQGKNTQYANLHSFYESKGDEKTQLENKLDALKKNPQNS